MDRGQNVAELRAQVRRVEDVAQGTGVACAGGDTEGDADIVDGLDEVGRLEGQGEGSAGGDGGGRNNAGDDGAGREGQGQEGQDGGGELHFEDWFLRGRRSGGGFVLEGD